jgi:hypothetical protein
MTREESNLFAIPSLCAAGEEREDKRSDVRVSQLPANKKPGLWPGSFLIDHLH